MTWGARGGPPKPPALRAPAKPWRSASAGSIEQSRTRGQLFEDPDFPVLHLEQDHVDPRLVVLIELDRAERRVLHVDFRERGANRRAVGLAVLLQRDLERGHHRVLE